MSETPKVAPFESCIGCYRGDTTTCIAFEGYAEYIIAGLQGVTGMPLEEAAATLRAGEAAERGVELDPGQVPAGRVTRVFRLCPECAEKAGVPRLGRVGGDELPCYHQDAADAPPAGGDA